MKIVRFCLALWLGGVVLQSFNCFSGVVHPSILVSGNMILDGNTRVTSRDLKGSNFFQGNSGGDVSLEDYRPYDPSPSSKAAIRPGPIEHGTPLMPYIPNPKPSPPPSSDEDESP